ncbi:hypothetical protein SUGI_0606650 [Cryptomeria japonica]|nr:hypothetical protein SUGI_0606650 [Cryptomeria japonica]
MVEDYCSDEKWGVKDRHPKQYHLKMDVSNDKIRVNASSTKFGRSGDYLGRRVLAKRFLIYMLGFSCCFFIARQFIDLFHPTTEKLLTQAHHPQLLRISNVVEEKKEDCECVYRKTGRTYKAPVMSVDLKEQDLEIISSDLAGDLLHVKDLKKLDAPGLGNKVFKTRVIMAAQEVIRCEKPKGLEIQGMKASIWEFRRGLFPSVAQLNDKIIKNSKAMKTFRPLHKVCACTMIWNQASFLKEWITYHGFLGIQRWFLYDNNSDDNIEEVVDSLGSFNVSRIVWPWIKSQEAGFSHCALRAREECEWVAFMDVDEFINPIEYIQNGTMFTDSAEAGPTVMQRLIDNATSVDTNALKIGEIRIDCHSFGPSGLTKHPIEGVIAGYTCRLNRTERHKSIIRPSALNLSLLNVVHHFHLKRGYRYRNLPRGFAVVNHYKYQVWDTFKAKFYRRVATYVTDWQENENESSKDRAPGLGTEPIEPSDWPERFCEVSDTFLRNFTIESFTDPVTQLQPWQQL